MSGGAVFNTVLIADDKARFAPERMPERVPATQRQRSRRIGRVHRVYVCTMLSLLSQNSRDQTRGGAGRRGRTSLHSADACSTPLVIPAKGHAMTVRVAVPRIRTHVVSRVNKETENHGLRVWLDFVRIEVNVAELTVGSRAGVVRDATATATLQECRLAWTGPGEDGAPSAARSRVAPEAAP